MTAIGLLAIQPDDRQLYGVEQLFNGRRLGNLELAESASSGPIAQADLMFSLAFRGRATNLNHTIGHPEASPCRYLKNSNVVMSSRLLPPIS